MSQPAGQPQVLSLLEVGVIARLLEGDDSGAIASAMGLPRDEVVSIIGGLLGKLPFPDSGHHPHLSPLDDDQLLAHVRFEHARDDPRLRSVEPEELPRLHLLMHHEPPPSPA